MHSARPISLGLPIFVASGHWRRGSMPRTSRRRNATASRTIASSTVLGQRTPPSFAQWPHGPAAGSLSSRPRNSIRHVGRVDVRLHRRELAPPRLEHRRDPGLVLLPGHGRPHESAPVLRDGAVDLEQLERLLDLPVRQVDLRLEARGSSPSRPSPAPRGSPASARSAGTRSRGSTRRSRRPRGPTAGSRTRARRPGPRGRPAGSRRSASPGAGSGRRSRGRACRSPCRARPSRRGPSGGSRAGPARAPRAPRGRCRRCTGGRRCRGPAASPRPAACRRP